MICCATIVTIIFPSLRNAIWISTNQKGFTGSSKKESHTDEINPQGDPDEKATKRTKLILFSGFNRTEFLALSGKIGLVPASEVMVHVPSVPNTAQNPVRLISCEANSCPQK